MARVQKLWNFMDFLGIRSSHWNRQEHVDLSRERPGGCNGKGYHGAMSG
jgi:hypothetical protein